MRRRNFIAALSGAATTWALAARAQPVRAIHRVGYLSGNGSQSDRGPFLAAMLLGLREFGYVEGTNLIIEFRGAEAKEDRIPQLIAELVTLKPDVLVVPTVEAAIQAAKEATKTIPIVVVTSRDPVEMGLVNSLAHPGRNITGVFTLTNDLSGKRLDLLRQTVTGLSRVGVLRDADDPTTATRLADYELAAKALGIKIQSVEVRGTNPDLETTLQAAATQIDGLITITNTVLFGFRKRIGELAIKYQLPTMYQGAEWVKAGGLMSYAADDLVAYRRTAYYIDKILKGSRPEDLPIEQSTKIALAINLNTAKALGLAVPPALLVAADEVIE